MLASQFKKKKLKSTYGTPLLYTPSNENKSMQKNEKDENGIESSKLFSFNFDIPDPKVTESDTIKNLTALLDVDELDNPKINLKQKNKKKKKKKKKNRENDFESKKMLSSTGIDHIHNEEKQIVKTQEKSLLSIDANTIIPVDATHKAKLISNNISSSKMIVKNSTNDKIKCEKVVDTGILLQNDIQKSKMRNDNLGSSCSTDQKQYNPKVNIQSKIKGKDDSLNENVLPVNCAQESMHSFQVESSTKSNIVASQDFDCCHNDVTNNTNVQNKPGRLKKKGNHEKVFAFNFDFSPNDDVTLNISNTSGDNISQSKGKNRKRSKKKKRKERKKTQQQPQLCISNEYPAPPQSKGNLNAPEVMEAPSSQTCDYNKSHSMIPENIGPAQSHKELKIDLNKLSNMKMEFNKNLGTNEDIISHTMNLNWNDGQYANSNDLPFVSTTKEETNDKNILKPDHNNSFSKMMSASSNKYVENPNDNPILKNQVNDINDIRKTPNSSSAKYTPTEVLPEQKEHDLVIKARLKIMKKNKDAKRNKKNVATKAHIENKSQNRIKHSSFPVKQKQTSASGSNEKTLLKKQKLSFDSSIQAKATVNKRSLILHRLNKLKRENDAKMRNHSLHKIQQNENNTSHSSPSNLDDSNSFFAFDFNMQNKDLNQAPVSCAAESQNHFGLLSIGQTQDKVKQIEYVDAEKKDRGGKEIKPNRKKEESLSFNTSDKGRGMVNKSSMVLYKRKKRNGPLKDWTKTPVGSVLISAEDAHNDSSSVMKRGFDNAFSFGFSFNLS